MGLKSRLYICCTGHALECWLGSYSNVPCWSTYSSLPPADTLGGKRKRLVLSTESVSPFLPFSCPRLQSILTSGRISSPLQGVLACLRLLTTRNLFLLSFVFLYSGTSLSILTTLLFRLPLFRSRNILLGWSLPLKCQLHYTAA